MELLINDDDSELATAPEKIRSGRFSEVKLNIENSHFIRPTKLVRWRCLIDLSNNLGLNFCIVPPTKEDVKSYAGRMGLFKNTNYHYPHKESEPTTFFPLMKITNDRNEALYEECQRVFGYSNATANYINRVSDAFVELADNIYFHSGESANSGWGYIHAQAHLQSGNIRLGICDLGVGIYGSYERTHQLRNRDEAALTKEVFEELESSLNLGPKQGHRGLGLHEVRGLININTGLLKMYTGHTLVWVNQTGVYSQTNSFRTEGTWIDMRMPIR